MGRSMPPESDAMHRYLQGIRSLGDLEGGRRDLAGVLTRAADLVRDLSDAPLAFVGLRLEPSGGIAARSRAGRDARRTEPWEGPGPLAERVIEGEAPVAWTAQAGAGTPDAGDLAGESATDAWFGVPVPLGERGTGVLAVVGVVPDPAVQELLRLLGEHLATAVDNLCTYQKAEALALTDELTRLYNFRFLKAALKREMERAGRYGQTFSIIMIDVDHLKKYNDQYGHLGGSELLRQLAGILGQSSRAIDLVAKYGGDEFMVILPQTRLDGAVTMAQRIREAVAMTAFPNCAPGEMTVSVGVASFPQHGDTVEALVGAADRALFAAKRASRNCVVSADRRASSSEAA